MPRDDSRRAIESTLVVFTALWKIAPPTDRRDDMFLPHVQYDPSAGKSIRFRIKAR